MVERIGHTYRTVQELSSTTGVRPLGGGLGAPDAVKLISGLDGVVSSITAAAQEIQNASKELRILNQRHATMLGTPTSPGDQTQSITQSMTDAINNQTKVLTQALVTGTAHPQATRGAAIGHRVLPPVVPPPPTAPAGPTNPLAQGDSSGWRPAPPSLHPQSSQTQGLPQVPEQSSGHSPNQEVYERNRNFLRGDNGQFSLGNLRQTLGTRVQRDLGNRTWGPQLAQDDQGEWRHVDTNGAATGAKASDSEVSSFARRTKIMGAARGGAQTLAEGGTLREAGLAMLPEAAAGALGVVGAGIFAAQKAGEFAASQRAQNAQWQSMLGGSQTDALAERAKSKMFQWSQFGVMGGQDAAALYQGVAATGMNQNQRSVAQDFAVNNYKDLGMSVQDSMDIINTASKTGQQSLNGVAKALDDVTKSAKDANINTEVMRQQFTATWKAFSDIAGGANSGTTATAEAAGFTNAKAKLGPEFQDIKTQAADPRVMSMVASANGQTLSQLMAMGMEPGGQTAYPKEWTAYAKTRAGSLLGQQGQNVLSKYLKPGQKFSSLSDAQKEQVQHDIMATSPIDPRAIIQTLDDMGISGATPENALQMLLAVQTGDYDPGQEATKSLTSSRTHKIDVSQGSYTSLTLGGAQSKAYQSLIDDVHKHSDGGMWGWAPWANGAAKGAANAFLSDVKKTGRAGGISQSLVETAHNGTDIAKMVQVNAGGKKKTVSLEDAMKYYRDQIDAGTAKITEGSGKDKTVGAAMGMVGDSRLASKSGAAAASTVHSQITVSPTPALIKLLKFSPAGPAQIDPATGWSPPAAHVTAKGRPSGSVDVGAYF